MFALILFGCQGNDVKMMKWYENLKVGQSKVSVMKSIPDYILSDAIIWDISRFDYTDCISIEGPLPAFISPACIYNLCFAGDTLIYKGFNN